MTDRLPGAEVCIGWDGPCPVWGDFHGCRLPISAHVNDRGRPSAHVCVCGATAPTRDIWSTHRTGQSPVSCPDCGTGFPSGRSLGVHRRACPERGVG